MKRHIIQNLRNWQQADNRKPLIVKGVRQCGKSYTLQEFGRTDFPACHYVNFENQPTAAELFNGDFSPKRILQDLSFLLGKPIDVEHDLVIFDEIQACPRALTSLKYFAEQMPKLALCSAGSLLGLHLGDSSFPVGKVDFLPMRPMSFSEFLLAVDDEKSVRYLDESLQTHLISDIAHQHLWQQYKIYLVTGGLPEAVQTYVNHQDDLFAALTQVRSKQRDLIYGYYADIAKHSGKVNAMQIDRVWQAIPNQLAQSQTGSAKRFQFKGILPGVDRYQRIATVFDWLLAAELVIKVPVISHVELPLSAYTEESHFKLYMFDVGILGALTDLPPKSILDYSYGTYKGYFAENFVVQELLTERPVKLYCWQDNRAEVEFLYPENDQIIPIEVKSGRVTRNQSLNTYAEKYHPPYRVTFTARPLHIDTENQFRNYPLYMAAWFPRAE